MAVDADLDITPPFTFSTWQFHSETLNVIILALLASLIVANVGSVISKLVNNAPSNTFRYDSWLRSYIFANSDDPLRILTWLAGRDVFREKQWNRGTVQMRRARLIAPVTARMLILLISVAFIAISIPTRERLPGCMNGDYRLRWNMSQAAYIPGQDLLCANIPLVSRLGAATGSASACFTQSLSILPVLLAPEGSTRVMVWREKSGWRMGHAVSNATFAGVGMGQMLWKDNKRRDLLYYSDLSLLDLETYMEIAVRAVQDERPDCRASRPESESGEETEAMQVWMNCLVDLEYMHTRILFYIETGLVWEWQREIQRRLRIEQELDDVVTTNCPYDIIVSRPIANIIPLALALVVIFCVNVVVSFALKRRGDAMDCAFHLIKDALGHDTACNPLEYNDEYDSVRELMLRKWRCGSGGGGHVSFLAKPRDMPVDNFDDDIVVGGCVEAAIELRQVSKGAGP